MRRIVDDDDQPVDGRRPGQRFGSAFGEQAARLAVHTAQVLQHGQRLQRADQAVRVPAQHRLRQKRRRRRPTAQNPVRIESGQRAGQTNAHPELDLDLNLDLDLDLDVDRVRQRRALQRQVPGQRTTASAPAAVQLRKGLPFYRRHFGRRHSSRHKYAETPSTAELHQHQRSYQRPAEENGKNCGH